MQGVRAWIMQRVSAAVLVIFLGAHLVAVHYIDPGQQIEFVGVAMRLKGLVYLVVDGGLLGFGLFHGLNGLRNVILDYDISPGAARSLSWALAIFGSVAFIYGIYGLSAFLAG